MAGLIADADVLIDYARTEPDVIALNGALLARFEKRAREIEDEV